MGNKVTEQLKPVKVNLIICDGDMENLKKSDKYRIYKLGRNRETKTTSIDTTPNLTNHHTYLYETGKTETLT